MGLMGMHPTVGQKTRDMANALGIGKFGDDLFDGVGIGDGAGFDGLVNFGQFLHDHTASTQVHVTDFRVAHLTFGQANIQTTGLEEPARIVGVKVIPDRRIGKGDSVVLAFFAITPAVQNAQHHRARALYGIRYSHVHKPHR